MYDKDNTSNIKLNGKRIIAIHSYHILQLTESKLLNNQLWGASEVISYPSISNTNSVHQISFILMTQKNMSIYGLYIHYQFHSMRVIKYFQKHNSWSFYSSCIFSVTWLQILRVCGYKVTPLLGYVHRAQRYSGMLYYMNHDCPQTLHYSTWGTANRFKISADTIFSTQRGRYQKQNTHVL